MRTMRAQFSSLRSLSRLSHATPRSLSIQPRLLRAQRSQFRPFSSSFQRFNSASDPAPGQPQKSRLVEEPEGPQPPTPERAPQPSYDLTFTCTPCGTRSTHRISKQGYHHGSVLIACPGCRNRHVISDHLNVSTFYLSLTGICRSGIRLLTRK
jgi:protein import protein ZIM17